MTVFPNSIAIRRAFANPPNRVSSPRRPLARPSVDRSTDRRSPSRPRRRAMTPDDAKKITTTRASFATARPSRDVAIHVDLGARGTRPRLQRELASRGDIGLTRHDLHAIANLARLLAAS